jgi:hypothetical protein
MHRGCIPKGGPTKSIPSARPVARHRQSAHRYGIQAGLAAALAGGRADRSCERCLFGSSSTGGGRPERRSAIEVTDDLIVFDPELTGLPGGFTVISRGERGDAAFNSAIQFRSRRRLTRRLPMPVAGRPT